MVFLSFLFSYCIKHCPFGSDLKLDKLVLKMIVLQIILMFSLRIFRVFNMSFFVKNYKNAWDMNLFFFFLVFIFHNLQ